MFTRKSLKVTSYALIASVLLVGCSGGGKMEDKASTNTPSTGRTVTTNPIQPTAPRTPVTTPNPTTISGSSDEEILAAVAAVNTNVTAVGAKADAAKAAADAATTAANTANTTAGEAKTEAGMATKAAKDSEKQAKKAAGTSMAFWAALGAGVVGAAGLAVGILNNIETKKSEKLTRAVGKVNYAAIKTADSRSASRDFGASIERAALLAQGEENQKKNQAEHDDTQAGVRKAVEGTGNATAAADRAKDAALDAKKSADKVETKVSAIGKKVDTFNREIVAANTRIDAQASELAKVNGELDQSIQNGIALTQDLAAYKGQVNEFLSKFIPELNGKLTALSEELSKQGSTNAEQSAKIKEVSDKLTDAEAKAKSALEKITELEKKPVVAPEVAKAYTVPIGYSLVPNQLLAQFGATVPAAKPPVQDPANPEVPTADQRTVPAASATPR